MPKTQTKRWRDRVLKQTGGGRGGAEELPSAQRVTSARRSRRRSRTPRTRPADREVGEAAVSPPGSGPSDAPEQGALEDTGLACRPRRSRHSSQPGLPSRSRLLEGACSATSMDLQVLERLAREPRLSPYPWGYVRGPDWCLKPQIVPNLTYTMLFSTCPYDKVCQAGRARD